jgi:hypothetical protein
MRASTASFSIVAALAALLVSTGALACQCRELNLSTRIVGADVILVGRVSDIEPLKMVTVQPVEVVKGRVSGPLAIAAGDTDCDFFVPPVEPKVGDEFLLYLRKAKAPALKNPQLKNEYTASRCLASGPMPEKADELKAVRKRVRSGK